MSALSHSELATLRWLLIHFTLRSLGSIHMLVSVSTASNTHASYVIPNIILQCFYGSHQNHLGQQMMAREALQLAYLQADNAVKQ